MNNLETYKKAFVDSLSIDHDLVNEKLEYGSIPEWDSIAHMSLMSELEDRFNLSIETDDVIDFSGFQKGKEILKKYKIEI
jgi:acyl carrier protein